MRRLTSAALAAALGASLLTGAGLASTAQAEPDRKTPAAATPDTPAEDLASARLAAKLRGARVEILNSRTDSSTTWANPDGSLTTETSAGPIRFRRGNGWVDVDVALARQPDGSIASKAHPGGLKLAGAGGGATARSFAASKDTRVPTRDLVTLGTGPEAVALQWRGGLPEPRLDGARAVYPNAMPGADLVVEATRTGFEQFLLLNERPGEGGSFTLPLRADGVQVAQQTDGSVLFTEKRSGKDIATMPAPYMWDSTVDPRSGEHTRKVPVGLQVVQSGTDIELRLTPDAAFLADPATRYPVTVDPSSGTLSDVFDTWVQHGQTADQSTHTELKLGWPGDQAGGLPRVARSFITWDMTPIKDALVSSATLKLFNFHSWDCTKARAWEVWDTNTATTATRFTNQPAWLQKFATSTETRGNNCSNGGWVDANVTSLLQYWAGQPTLNRQGMGLRATDEADTISWKRFHSGNAAASQIPKIEVTYNYRPRTGTDQQAGPPFFAYNGEYVVNTTTPTLRDTYVDANDDKINGTFQIFDSATDTQVGAVLVSPYMPSGEQVEVTVPAGVLQNGKTYRFRTNPYDGLHYNVGWSAWKTFTVDAAAPSAPGAITSTDYPPNAWVRGAGQNGAFTLSPPSTDHHWLEWSLDETTWTKVATNGNIAPVTLNVTPTTNGTHVLQVRSADKAANVSEPVSYTFHVGAGGFQAPNAGDRTARQLPLIAETDGTRFDSVSFSWRRAQADPWLVIPAGHVTSGGTALATWPVALTGGRNSALVWNVLDTVGPDGDLQIKADFTGPAGASASTEALRVGVDRNAQGAASAEVGPGAVNLLTGDFSLTNTDVSTFEVEVSRTFSSLRPDAGGTDEQAPIFGPAWSSGVLAEVSKSQFSHITRISGTAVEVIDVDGDAIHFTANAAGTAWIPELGAEAATLTGGLPGGPDEFKLGTDYGSVITFAKVGPAATTWQVTSVIRDGLEYSGTRVVSEPVTVNGRELARPKRVIAPTSAVPAAACETNPTTKGCRVVEFGYANTTTGTDTVFGDYAGRVVELRIWATAPGASASTATPVAKYAYDSAGRLREVWDPRITPALKTGYAYDGAGRVRELTPPGDLPYTFVYGRAGNGTSDGMLLKVTRPGLQQGSADLISGTNATSFVYGVPLAGPKAPRPMSVTDVAVWGQTDAPSEATAIFPADVVPASHSGTDLTATGYPRAGLHYLNTQGYLVNTADARGGITTAQYDRFGNITRSLSASNRLTALGVTDADRATLTDLGISGLPPAQRADLLSTRSTYSDDGSREKEKLGPLHRVQLTAELKDGATVVLPAGSGVAARSQVATDYDQGRPTDGTAVARNLPTTVTNGARPHQFPHLLADPVLRTTAYDWTLGTPTVTVLDPAGLAITKTTEYDVFGRPSKTLLPKSNGNDAGTTVTTYYSATGTGACAGRPEWADFPCSTSFAGAITGGGTNPAELPTKTTEYGPHGEVVKVTESVGGVAVTTNTTLDAAGRATGSAIIGGLGAPVPATGTEYDPSTGRVTHVTSAGSGSVVAGYDRLGRRISYTDADAGLTTTEYDLLDRPVRVADSVPSVRTYTYDPAKDPRDLPTSVTDSVAGTFDGGYDIDGALVEEKLPGGYTMRQQKDPTGTVRARSFSRDSDGTTVLAESVTRSTQERVVARNVVSGLSSTRAYHYDTAGRVLRADDTVNGSCVTRGYAFDRNTNRTTGTTATGAMDAPCPTAAQTTVNHTYDSADRIVDAGYSYDAFGRTLTAPGGTTLEYHANDKVRRQQFGARRQTWNLDALDRFRSWIVESNNAGTWTQTAAKVNHYSDDEDTPSWIVEDTAGTVTRNVASLGGFAATTSKTGDVVLQLTDLHGDIAVRLPLTPGTAPTVQYHDEFGNPRTDQTPSRYGWLGGEQRSTETLTGITLMGARLYDPTIGRFLSVDPVPGGGANAYTYCSGDGVNCTDTSGRLDYMYSFNLGFSFNSKEYHFMLFRWNFGKIFPLQGRAKSIYYGDEGMFMPLRTKMYGKSFNFNVRVGYIGEWSLRLDAAPGSVVHGRNSYILFWLGQSGAPQPGRGFLTLHVRGHTSGGTLGDNRFLKRFYKDGAYATWSKLASNFRSYLRSCRCTN